ncbi:hypothetical protein OESDEN_07528, partial [Oesophagostomum dentatum]
MNIEWTILISKCAEYDAHSFFIVHLFGRKTLFRPFFKPVCYHAAISHSASVHSAKNNIPIDNKYYLTNQLAKPLARIFEPILGDRAEKILIEGEHTRVRTVVQSKVGGLAAFTKKQVTCLGCKAVLKDQRRAVCDFCIKQGKLPEIYAQRVRNLNTVERHFSRLWTECQNCAKTMHDKVNCSARDCPIFYMREKVRNDLREAHAAIERF